MKRILVILFMFLSVYCYADTLESTNYATTNSTITISSSTVTTITAEPGYKEVYIGDPSTTASIFYRVDGSTINVPTVGWWIPAGQGQKIGFSGNIYLQLGNAASSVTVRLMRFWR